MENISLVLDGDGTCGLRLDGGGNQPIFVSKLHRRGRAHRAGVRIGDEVVSVCGISCKNLDAQSAQDIIRNTNNARIQVRRKQQQSHFTQPSATYDDFDSDIADGYNPPPPSVPPHRSQHTFSKSINVYSNDTHAQTFRHNQPSSIREDSRNYNEYSNQRFLVNDYFNLTDHNDQSTKYRKMDYGLNYGSPNSDGGLVNKQHRIEKHITRAYIVPEYGRIEPKELHNVSTHTHHYIQEQKQEDQFKERFHKPTIETEDMPSPIVWKPKLQPITEHHHPMPTMREEVIIWSSKPLPKPLSPSVFKRPPSPPPPPPPPPIQIIPPPPPPVVEPPIPPTPPPKTDESPGVVVNEDLIEAGLLTRGVVTAAGIPVEVHLEKRKLFSDSSFYEDPGHKYPTIEEQIKMARKVAHLLTSHTGKTGKGQKMFQKKQEQSANWVNDLDPMAKATIEREKMKKKMMEETYERAFHDGEGPFDQKSRVERAKELEKMRLKEEKSLHNVVPFDLCARLANELKQDKGRGGHLFSKRKEESKNWVVSENDPQLMVGYKPYNHELNPFKKPLDFTPLKTTTQISTTPTPPTTLKLPMQGAIQAVFDEVPRNRLKDMINTPRPAMTPWDSIVNTGNLDKAFEHLKDRFYLDGRDGITGWGVEGVEGGFGGGGGGLGVIDGIGGGSLNSPLQSKSFMPPHQPRSYSSQSQSSYVKYQPIKFQPRFM